VGKGLEDKKAFAKKKNENFASWPEQKKDKDGTARRTQPVG